MLLDLFLDVLEDQLFELFFIKTITLLHIYIDVDVSDLKWLVDILADRQSLALVDFGHIVVDCQAIGHN